MIQPPYSLDLNLIKNLQAIMKREIYKLYPELESTPDTVATLEVLINALREVQYTIDSSVLYNLSVTIPHRVKAVIATKGQYTKY